MEIPAVGNTPLLGAASGAATLTQTFDSFLLLLTTQLQNQDPLDPMDSDKFTSQLVQFTGVEQSIATNTNLEQLIAMFRANEFSGAVQYIGKFVEAPGGLGALSKGSAEWSYSIHGQASETTVKIVNDKGLTVFWTQGKISTGTHSFVWDGNDAAGNPVPDGAYTLKVASRDQEGNDVDVTLSAFGRVTGVHSEAGETSLDVGAASVLLRDILSVKEAPGGA